MEPPSPEPGESTIKLSGTFPEKDGTSPSPAIMTEADFLQFLHECGLTAVDGARTIEQLAREYRIRRWYDFIDVVYLPPSPLFLENRERYYVRCHTPTTLVPPAEFCCDFDFTGKAFENHQLALERCSALFGAPEKGAAVNTWSHTWRFEGASLELTTFIWEKTSRLFSLGFGCNATL